jgi:hypothetical protein
MANIIDDTRFEESPEFFEVILNFNPTERVTVSPGRTTIQIFDESSKLLKKCTLVLEFLAFQTVFCIMFFLSFSFSSCDWF